MILISSITGYNPEPALSMYAVTKTALLGLTKVHAFTFSISMFPGIKIFLVLCYFKMGKKIILLDC